MRLAVRFMAGGRPAEQLEVVDLGVGRLVQAQAPRRRGTSAWRLDASRIWPLELGPARLQRRPLLPELCSAGRPPRSTRSAAPRSPPATTRKSSSQSTS